MNKVIRDNKVAVLYSPRYGAGWYTEHHRESLLFHPEIVKLVEGNRRHEITEELCLKLLDLNDKKDKEKDQYYYNEDEYNVFCDGAEALKIKWIEKEQEFEIKENNGYEMINLVYPNHYLKA